ncbi:MAG: preprotein translocase, YajC subunit [Treponematales bacterium]|jgi:preprotein translocase subunit YajC
MESFVFSLLSAAQQNGGGAAEAPSGAAAFVQFIPFIAIIAIFYFLIIRPQNKKQKETQKMLAALKKGDKIVTIGGIHGVIHSVKENSVIVKVDEDTKVEFTRSAIASVTSQGREEDEGGKQALPDSSK